MFTRARHSRKRWARTWKHSAKRWRNRALLAESDLEDAYRAMERMKQERDRAMATVGELPA